MWNINPLTTLSQQALPLKLLYHLSIELHSWPLTIVYVTQYTPYHLFWALNRMSQSLCSEWSWLRCNSWSWGYFVMYYIFKNTSSRAQGGFVSPKPKYIKFTVRHDKEKQQTFTLEKLQPGNVWHFLLKTIHYQNKCWFIFCQLTNLLID